MLERNDYPELIEGVTRQLQRIADALEILAGKNPAPPPPIHYAEILSLVTNRTSDRERFAKIVYENATLPPKEICKMLKSAGLLGKATYWRDVGVLNEMGLRLRPETTPLRKPRKPKAC
jgi:hypothetical protein